MRTYSPLISWLIALLMVFPFFALGITPAFAETLSLTESKVIELALEQNLSAQIARADRDIGETAIQGSKSVYDTHVFLGADHLIDKRDQAIPLFGTDNRTTNWDMGVARAFPTGTRASIDWTNQRNSTNSPFASINPYYDAQIDLSLRQPVMKNAFGHQDRGGVALAKKRFESVDLATRRRVLQAVFGALVEYWGWVTQKANASVTERSAAEARLFERQAGDKKIFGLYESTDVLAAKASRMQLENQVLEARRARDDAEGRLKRSLNLESDAQVVSGEKVPLVRSAGVSGGREAALQRALDNRSDYGSARAAVEARKIEVSLAKNRKWPQLDLLASLKLNGVDGAYDNSLGEIGGADHPAYLVGGEFSWPIENRLARSESRRANHESRKALYELKDVENGVVQDVEERLREVETTRKQVLADREIERVQREKWQLESKKYGTGRSSSDLVIRFQEDYLGSQRQALGSLYRHRIAVLGLKLAEETLVGVQP